MDPLDNTEEALAFLKSKREPEPVNEAESTEELKEEAEPEVVEAETESEIEEVESELEEVALEDDDGPLVYQFKDEEVTEQTIQDWKDGYLRQSDYTKKTMKTADRERELTAKESALGVKEQKLDDLIAVLEGEVSTKDIDWDDLIENDPSEYLKQQKVLEAKKEALKVARATKDEGASAKLLDYQVQQNAIIAEKLPHWLDAEKRGKDIALIEKWVIANDVDSNEVNQVGSAWTWMALLKAAKYDALQSKEPEVKKKLSKVPKVIKPTKARATPSNTSVHDDARKRLKSTGKDKDALAYLKSRRSG